MNKNYENNLAQYELKQGVLYVRFKKDLIINHEIALALVADRLRLQSFTKYKAICDVSDILSIDSEARRYLSIYGSSLLTQVALVSTNIPLYHMARFYININKPKVPTAIFMSIKEAEKYLTLPL
ncbi:hypothetical protein [Flavobacterium sp. I3-2]|uniref:DUF7793 family protein n=1 Tax=Flavobacterium sp. I3-2 TaxID=2748319 RepID=UPI0015B27553|nr:hypothetical protein [Flavobacterium sp. I3-2]